MESSETQVEASEGTYLKRGSIYKSMATAKPLFWLLFNITDLRMCGKDTERQSVYTFL